MYTCDIFVRQHSGQFGFVVGRGDGAQVHKIGRGQGKALMSRRNHMKLIRP